MNDAIVKAQEFIDRIRDSGVFVSNASVFGSWAKGTAHGESDIDVCVYRQVLERIISPRW